MSNEMLVALACYGAAAWCVVEAARVFCQDVLRLRRHGGLTFWSVGRIGGSFYRTSA